LEQDEEIKPGYYKDHHGVWHRDRRNSTSRRKAGGPSQHHDRRANYGRRKADEEFEDRSAREEIRDALNEFEEEHGQSTI
jgi:hypothetical protein